MAGENKVLNSCFTLQYALSHAHSL